MARIANALVILWKDFDVYCQSVILESSLKALNGSRIVCGVLRLNNVRHVEEVVYPIRCHLVDKVGATLGWDIYVWVNGQHIDQLPIRERLEAQPYRLILRLGITLVAR